MKISLNQITLIILGLFVLVLTGLASVYLYQKLQPEVSTSNTSERNLALRQEAAARLEAAPEAGLPSAAAGAVNNISATSTVEADIVGEIFFSASLYGDQNFIVDNYQVDLEESAEREELVFDRFTTPFGGWLVGFDDETSPTRAFYIHNVTLTEADKEGHRETPRSLSSTDMDGDDVENFENVLESEMHSFVYSTETDRLAFTAWNQGSNPYAFPTLDNWKVVILNIADGSQIDINGAHNPLWLEDGETLIYMRKDGVYAYDVLDRTESMIEPLPADRNFYIAASAAISPQKDRILLVLDGEVVIYNVIYDDEGAVSFEQYGRFTTEGVQYYWPMFSPDGQHYALQAIDVFSDGYRENPRIEIRPIDSFDSALWLWTGDFTFETTVLNYWLDEVE